MFKITFFLGSSVVPGRHTSVFSQYLNLFCVVDYLNEESMRECVSFIDAVKRILASTWRRRLLSLLDQRFGDQINPFVATVYKFLCNNLRIKTSAVAGWKSVFYHSAKHRAELKLSRHLSINTMSDHFPGFYLALLLIKSEMFEQEKTSWLVKKPSNVTDEIIEQRRILS